MMTTSSSTSSEIATITGGTSQTSVEISAMMTTSTIGRTPVTTPSSTASRIATITSGTGETSLNTTTAFTISTTNSTLAITSMVTAGTSIINSTPVTTPPSTSSQTITSGTSQTSVKTSARITASTISATSYPITVMFGTCPYRFDSAFEVTVNCSAEMVSSTIASFTNSSLSQNVSKVIVVDQPPMSKLSPYLCNLPSRQIDLSGQQFVVLDDDTFPCNNSYYRTINLTDNQISSVNITLRDWDVIDLSRNSLTVLPYTILLDRPIVLSRFSLSHVVVVGYGAKVVNLESNELHAMDLWAYASDNITVDLTMNDFHIVDGFTVVMNMLNLPLIDVPDEDSTVQLPTSLKFLVNDTLAENYGTCNQTTLVYLIEFLEKLQNSSNVSLDCTCASVNLRTQYRILYAANITDKFPCSNEMVTDSFLELNCTNMTNMNPTAMCNFTALKVDSSTALSTFTASNGQSNLAIILGSVLGSVGFLILISTVCAVLYWKFKEPKSSVSPLARNKTVAAAHSYERAPESRLEERIQTRNPRILRRLPPLQTQISQLGETLHNVHSEHRATANNAPNSGLSVRGISVDNILSRNVARPTTEHFVPLYPPYSNSPAVASPNLQPTKSSPSRKYINPQQHVQPTGSYNQFSEP
ncbi:unnamed protein product [Didymodactylos carnosus]|uniref:Uncharacterized protein n=1 Tax=Didymodactylos carnosus TaxID=1234261 RepID=A0A815KNG3_9BILA|nr:unnamed protein product [Didymodactylos carnosus]CAF4292734.1 unnamed protein product [Didymodactylos carnosus]